MFMQDPQLFGLKSAVKGWLSGSLFFGAIVGGFDVSVQIVLIIIGLLLFLDSLYQFGQTTFVLTTVLFFVLGGLVIFFAYLGQVLIQYVIICVVIIIVAYANSVFKRVRHNLYNKAKH